MHTDLLQAMLARSERESYGRKAARKEHLRLLQIRNAAVPGAIG